MGGDVMTEAQDKLNILQQALASLQVDLRVFEAEQQGIEPLTYDNAVVTHSKAFQIGTEDYIAQLIIPEGTAQIFANQTEEFINMKLDLKTILDSCREVIFVSDAKGKALRVSASWKEIWKAEGINFFEKDVFQVEKDGVITPSATRLVSEKKERVQIIQQTDNGRTLIVTGTPIKDENGDIKRIVSISEDITEISTLKKENKRLHALINDETVSSLVFNSDPMHDVLLTAFKAATVDSTVLITGESGVGKELIVDYIHNWSNRSEKPLIKVNCGSIPENLLESELFGYVSGAFTGALKEGKQGLFEAANDGTIFLDEIGDMPLSLQVKLLRVLQEQEVTRIGETVPIKINVRVIAATNRNLPEEVKLKTFREDLYYRLNVVPVYVPPLRDRSEDLLPLILHFTEEFNRKFSKMKVFSPESIKQFYVYSWPGNIRELRNIIERLIVLTDTNYLEPIHLPDFLQMKSSGDVVVNKSEIDNPDSILSERFIELAKLVRYYRVLGLTHGEWGLVCAIFTYEAKEWTFHITEEVLAQHLACGTRQISKWLYSLRTKGFMIVEQNKDGKGFNFKPLIEAGIALNR